MNEGATRIYLGYKIDFGPCPLKEQCCPNTPARKIPRSVYEHAREVAHSLVGTPALERSPQRRKRIEMPLAHLKRILKVGRLRLRGPREVQAISCWQPGSKASESSLRWFSRQRFG